MLCRSSVDLKVSRGGAVLPASQGLNDSRATQRTCSLPVEPQAQALLAEHVLQTNIMYDECFIFREVENAQLTHLSKICAKQFLHLALRVSIFIYSLDCHLQIITGYEHRRQLKIHPAAVSVSAVDLPSRTTYFIK